MSDKPEQCPECGATSIAGIMYGLPDFNEELDRELDERRVVLGGCVVFDDAPKCTATSAGMSLANSISEPGQAKQTVVETATVPAGAAFPGSLGSAYATLVTRRGAGARPRHLAQCGAGPGHGPTWRDVVWEGARHWPLPLAWGPCRLAREWPT